MYLKYILISFFLLTTNYIQSQNNAKELGAIWFIGDSITQSNADGDNNDSPRKSLYDLLTTDGYTFNYTGHHKKNIDGLPETGDHIINNLYHYHSGVSGILIGDPKRKGMTTLLSNSWKKGRLAKVKPDIILIMLGTNDVGHVYELEKAPNRLRNLLDDIYNLPGIGNPKVFLASIPPNRRNDIDRANVAIFNESIPSIVDQYKSKGKEIYFVDQFSPIDNAYKKSMRKDNLHPNKRGNKKIAEQWFKAIKNSQKTNTEAKNNLVDHIFPGDKTDFYGFDKYKFKTKNVPITVICPKKTIKGKPWLWRSLFWEAIPAFRNADLKLVEEGYHVVLVHGDVSGHPKGNKNIDIAYNLLTNEYGFAKKFSMASMSRGTLSLFRWATTNPKKVESIYVDNGVCNIMSWPAGKLVPGNNSIANGAPKSWTLFKNKFGYTTDKEALNSKESPIDLLEPLAKEGVPIIMVGGLKDTAVPYTENELIMKERYEKLGGSIKVILEDKGHSHGMKDPTPILQFIRKHSSI